MEIEELDIYQYLIDIRPLNQFDEQGIAKVMVYLEIEYFRKNEFVYQLNDEVAYIYLIRKGAVELISPLGDLKNRLSDGDWFGQSALLRYNGIAANSIKVLEDSLIYRIDSKCFLSLCTEYPNFKEFFTSKKARRIRNAIEEIKDANTNQLLVTEVKELVNNKPLIFPADTALKTIANSMLKKNTTGVLIGEASNIEAVLTERLFSKAMVENLDGSQPVSKLINTNKEVITIKSHAKLHEALLIMGKKSIRHLPVFEDNKLLGMITAVDIIRKQINTDIFIIPEIYNTKSITKLTNVSKLIPETFASVVKCSLPSYDIGKYISSIGEAITVRIIQLAIDKLGAPPIDFCWLSAGSQARGEQTSFSDQDNGLLLSDDYNPDKHADYFKKLAIYVSDGLDKCGYFYCPGNVMATNDKWRQPYKKWQEYFDKWIDIPTPEAILHCDIFFDLKAIYGNKNLMLKLREYITVKTQKSSIFIRHLAESALQFTPPLGLFRGFLLEKSGEQKKFLNMKKRGITPLIDTIRVYALASGVSKLNTRGRILKLMHKKIISKGVCEDLLDAYEFISIIRMQHQARQINNNQSPDNHVLPETLSSLERHHLKDAFVVIQDMQNNMTNKFIR